MAMDIFHQILLFKVPSNLTLNTSKDGFWVSVQGVDVLSEAGGLFEGGEDQSGCGQSSRLRFFAKLFQHGAGFHPQQPVGGLTWECGGITGDILVVSQW